MFVDLNPYFLRELGTTHHKSYEPFLPLVELGVPFSMFQLLQSAKDTLTSIILMKINADRPSVLKEINAFLLGKTSINITDIHFDELSIQDLSIRPKERDSALQVALEKFTLTVKFNFDVRSSKKFIRSSGAVNAHIKDFDSLTRLSFDYVDGNTVSKIQRNALRLDYLKVRVTESRISWLYNAFLIVFNRYLKARILKIVNEKIRSTLPPALNKFLASLEDYELDDGRKVDISLFTAPEITATNLNLLLNGLFKEPEECPYKYRTGSVHSGVGDNKFTVIIYENLLSCFFWSLGHDGVLSKYLDDQLNSMETNLFDTEAWKEIAPSLSELYPNTRMVIKSDKISPVVEFKGGKINVKGKGILKFFVNGNLVMAYELKYLFELTAAVTPERDDMDVSYLTFKAIVEEAKITLRLLANRISPINLEGLDRILGILSRIIPKYAAENLDLSYKYEELPFFEMAFPSLTVHDGFITFQTEIQLPSDSSRANSDDSSIAPLLNELLE
jgi:hypothetical protein